MILQSLCEYYERQSKIGKMPRYGYENIKISYVIVIDKDGRFINLEDWRIKEKNKFSGREILLPKSVKRTRAVVANFLWDNATYVLGITDPDSDKNADQNIAAFKEKANQVLKNCDDIGALAVLRYLECSNTLLVEHSLYQEIEKADQITFRLDTDTVPVCMREKIIVCYENWLAEQSHDQGICLVTGKQDGIEQTHPSIKGLSGAQPTGANIVSYNQDAFCSFGKVQGENAPVGKKAAFEYTTALNYLLRKDSPNKWQISKMTCICWAEANTKMENCFANMFSNANKDDPNQGVNDLIATVNAVLSGNYVENNSGSKFYILGLVANVARISVQLWQISTVKNVAQSIKQWFDDINIVGAENNGIVPLGKLIYALSREYEISGAKKTASGELSVPSHIISALMLAIINKSTLPESLLETIIQRIKKSKIINSKRMAILKALLNRKFRLRKEREVTVSLNINDNRQGYLLGRLFSVFAKLQEEANGENNSTIMDRYYNSASSTPSVVFGTLMRLHVAHLSKINSGRKVYFEKLIQSVVSNLNGFANHLNPEEQALFALGFYHQREDFSTKKSDS